MNEFGTASIGVYAGRDEVRKRGLTPNEVI